MGTPLLDATAGGYLLRRPDHANPFGRERAVSRLVHRAVCAARFGGRSVPPQHKSDCAAREQADGAMLFPAEHCPADTIRAARCTPRAAKDVCGLILKKLLGGIVL